MFVKYLYLLQQLKKRNASSHSKPSEEGHIYDERGSEPQKMESKHE